eukprot:TRINITY_DN1297_c0_g2_i6.p1 TRINITY_DN1297_c0_g2~~TRINITY_DN1297_c0_g2_i6.p1  ORF type:complete len:806 (+),score=189.82 TRINITY_DN1297_c0_g2_i6:50-2467(+)
MQTAPLFKLPSDVIFKILCECDLEFVFNFRQTCTDLFNLVESPDFWRWKSILDFRLFTQDVMSLDQQRVDWKSEYFTMYAFWVCVRENELKIRPEDEDIVKYNDDDVDHCMIEFLADPGIHDDNAAAVQGKYKLYPLPFGNFSIGYYELTVVNRGKSCAIGIGLALHDFVRAMPGWGLDSYGFHGDDGRLFNEKPTALDSHDFDAVWEEGETIGIGIDFANEEIFFTRNGNLISVAVVNLRYKYHLYPTVGLHSLGEVVKVNFGREPFKFDIVEYMKENDVKGKLAIKENNFEPQEITQYELKLTIQPRKVVKFRLFSEVVKNIEDQGTIKIEDIDHEKYKTPNRNYYSDIVESLTDSPVKFIYEELDFFNKEETLELLTQTPPDPRASRRLTRLVELIEVDADIDSRSLESWRDTIISRLEPAMANNLYSFLVRYRDSPEIRKANPFSKLVEFLCRSFITCFDLGNYPNDHPMLSYHMALINSYLNVTVYGNMGDLMQERLVISIILAYRILNNVINDEYNQKLMKIKEKLERQDYFIHTFRMTKSEREQYMEELNTVQDEQEVNSEDTIKSLFPECSQWIFDRSVDYIENLPVSYCDLEDKELPDGHPRVTKVIWNFIIANRFGSPEYDPPTEKEGDYHFMRQYCLNFVKMTLKNIHLIGDYSSWTSLFASDITEIDEESRQGTIAYVRSEGIDINTDSFEEIWESREKILTHILESVVTDPSTMEEYDDFAFRSLREQLRPKLKEIYHEEYQIIPDPENQEEDDNQEAQDTNQDDNQETQETNNTETEDITLDDLAQNDDLD